MFIQTEATPNPATLKFLPGCDVMGSSSVSFSDSGDASRSPLASRLFEINGISAVYLGGDFISATKGDGFEWGVIKPQVLGAIMDHFSSGKPVMEDGDEGQDEEEIAGEDSDVVVKIKELLDTRVRPAVAQDGGDIVFRKYEDGVVYLDMQGACSGCPSATMTLRNGVENMLRHYIPEVTEVREI